MRNKHFYLAILFFFGGLLATQSALAVSQDTTIKLEVVAPTPTNPPPATIPPSGGGGTVLAPDNTWPHILNLNAVKISYDSAQIGWETDKETHCLLRWGNNADYSLGSLAEITFFATHTVFVKDLSPNNLYHYQVTCTDRAVHLVSSPDATFTSHPLPDTIAPTNISNLRLESGNRRLTLRWTNPPSADFSRVRVIRSTQNFPHDPWDGSVAYEANGTFVVDQFLTNGQRYYYAVFSFDAVGNYSSGAIISGVPYVVSVEPPLDTTPSSQLKPPVVLGEKVVSPTELFNRLGFVGETKTNVRTTTAISFITSSVATNPLTFKDFLFSQNNEPLAFIEVAVVKLKSEQPTTITLNASKVADSGATVLLGFKFNNDVTAYTMALNKDKATYTALVNFPQIGTYQARFVVLDRSNIMIQDVIGTVLANAIADKNKDEKLKILGVKTFGFIKWIWPLLLLLLLLLLRKRRKNLSSKENKEQNKEQPLTKP